MISPSYPFLTTNFSDVYYFSMIWNPGGPERVLSRTTSQRPDFLHTTPREILLPGSLHDFIATARKNTFASGNPPIQIPGRLGYNRYDYHENGTNVYYEDEYFDNPKVPGLFSGQEIVKTYGRGGTVFVTYQYAGELTELGLEMGEDVVYPKLQYFLKEYADEARFGKSFEVEHRDKGKWEYVNVGYHGERIWVDDEYLQYKGKTVYQLHGMGSIYR